MPTHEMMPSAKIQRPSRVQKVHNPAKESRSSAKKSLSLTPIQENDTSGFIQRSCITKVSKLNSQPMPSLGKEWQGSFFWGGPVLTAHQAQCRLHHLENVLVSYEPNMSEAKLIASCHDPTPQVKKHLMIC